jgi:hypothetical protein
MRDKRVCIVSANAEEMPVTPHLVPGKSSRAADGQLVKTALLRVDMLTPIDDNAWVSEEGVIYVMQPAYNESAHSWFTAVPTYVYLTSYGAAMLESRLGARVEADAVLASGLPTRFDSYLNAVDKRTSTPIGRAYPVLYARSSDYVTTKSGRTKSVRGAVDVNDFDHIWDGKHLMRVTLRGFHVIGKAVGR